MTRRGERRTSRRGFLVKLGSAAAVATGLGVGITSTGAFTTVSAVRPASFTVAEGANALVGVVDQGPVKKNSRDPLVELTNNTGATLSVTVTLANCADGMLYDNNGGSGCSVTVTLAAGNAQFIDIQAAVSGTVAYTVDAAGAGFSLQTVGSVLSETGNNPGAIRIQAPNKDQDFDARANRDEWTIKSVDVRDDDGDDELDRVEFEVTEGNSGGTVVASSTVQTPPDRYKENNLTLTPDTAGYDVVAGQLYTLTVTAYDADGNFATATVQDTA